MARLVSSPTTSHSLDLVPIFRLHALKPNSSLTGYERELNYRRDDKSFSAFGNDRPGSTWYVNAHYSYLNVLELQSSDFL